MAFPASDVIRVARDKHPGFTEQSTPNPVLLRELTEFTRDVRGLVVKYDVDVLATTETIALPLANFAAGHTLAAEPAVVQGGDVTFPDGVTADFDLIDWKDRHQVIPRWSGWLRGQTLYLAGREAWWNGLTNIVLVYVPVQPALTAVADSILLPDRARPVIIWRLARFMAGRVPNDSSVPVDKRDIDDNLTRAEMRFEEDLQLGQRAQVSATREVW